MVFAVALPGVAAVAGSALDYGRLTFAHAALQRTVDAAALAGAKSLATTSGTAAQRQAAAVLAAQRVGTGMSPLASTTATAAFATQTVQVQSSQNLTLMFGAILPRTVSTVSTQGTAVYAGVTGCITALNSGTATGITVQGSAKISAPSCPVWSNSTSTSAAITVVNSGAISALKTCAVGGGSGSISPALKSGCDAAPDPFAGKVSATTNSCTQNSLTINSSTSLTQGVYCGGLTIKSGTVSLSPGLYEIRNGPLNIQGASVVNRTGVSFLLGPGAYLDFQGNPTLSISAMTTGSLAGILIASDPTAATQTSTIQGNITLVLTANLDGSIYLPNQSLSVGGSSDLKLKGAKDMLVAGTIVVAGSSTVTSSAVTSANPTVRLTR